MLLSRAGSEIAIAGALWKDGITLGGASCISAMSHLDRCVDLTTEAKRLCKPYCLDSQRQIGFDRTDISDEGVTGLFHAYHSLTEAFLLQGRALAAREITCKWLLPKNHSEGFERRSPICFVQRSSPGP